MRKGWASWDCSVRKRESSGVNLINAYKYLKEGGKEDRVRLVSDMPNDRTRGDGHKLKHRRFPLHSRKQFFHCDSYLALAQTAQGGCGDSFLGDTQEPSGHSTGKLALGGPEYWGWIRWPPEVPSNLNHPEVLWKWDVNDVWRNGSVMPFRTNMELKSIASIFLIITEWKIENLKKTI